MLIPKYLYFFWVKFMISIIIFNSFLDSFDKLSLGDARAYYLSTAKNELGVISAQSAAGI